MSRYEETEGSMSWVKTSNFFVRMIVILLFIWLPIQILVSSILLTQDLGIGSPELGYFYMSFPLLIPIFMEWRIRVDRRKKGLPIYRGVNSVLYDRIERKEEADLEMKYDSEIGANVDSSSDKGYDEKKDLNYWFELREKGAITDEEYEVKKRGLI